jgi:hypothetical protein
MKKINTRKTLKIKNNKVVIEESWDTLLSKENLKTLVTTAFMATRRAWERLWNTMAVLPWKLGKAMYQGKDLSTVMDEWERKDKTIKQAQLNVIQQTGVGDTVNAMMAFCNPAAYAFQEFCEWEDPDLKEAWGKGVDDFWNNTVGAKWKDLRTDAKKKTASDESKILYANFIVMCSKIINLPIEKQTIINDDNSRNLGTSLNNFISPSNNISKKNSTFKNLLLFFASNEFLQNKAIQSVSSKNQIASIQGFDKLRPFFSNAAKKNLTIENAASTIAGEGLTGSLMLFWAGYLKEIADTKKAEFRKAFKNYTPTSSATSSSKESSSEESSSEESSSEEVKASGVAENIFNKKTLLIKNSSILKEGESPKELNEKQLQEIEKVIKKSSQKYSYLITYLYNSQAYCIVYMSALKMHSLLIDLNSHLKTVMTEDLKQASTFKFDSTKQNEKIFESLKSLFGIIDKTISNINKANEKQNFYSSPENLPILKHSYQNEELTSEMKSYFTFDSANLYESMIKAQIPKSLGISEEDFKKVLESIKDVSNLQNLQASVSAIELVDSFSEKEFKSSYEDIIKEIQSLKDAKQKLSDVIKDVENDNEFITSISKFPVNEIKDLFLQCKQMKQSCNSVLGDFEALISEAKSLKTIDIQTFRNSQSEVVSKGFAKYMEVLGINADSSDSEKDGTLNIDSDYSKTILINNKEQKESETSDEQV